jgi:hypothetical protein
MKTIHTRAFVGAGIVSALLLTTTTSAGIITHTSSIPPGPDPVASGPGLGLVSVPIIFTPFPNNDNVSGGEPTDNNIDVNLKRFDFNDYIDIEFTVSPSGGVTEYRVHEFVDNNTGLPWIGYRMQLGFGTGAAFVLAPPGSGLDFDAPLYDPPPTSTAMVPTLLSPNEIAFSGFHAAGAQIYEVRIDVPDLSVTGFGSFTLRQIPIPIPEPGSLVLAGLAAIGWLSYRRR